MTAVLDPPTTDETTEELAAGWGQARLRDLLIHALGGAWGSSPDPTDVGLVHARVIRGTEFRKWDSDRGRGAALRAIDRGSLERRVLRAGDVVLEISGGGPAQPVGRTLLIDERAISQADHPLICSNFCRQLRLHPLVNPSFANYALKWMYQRGDFNAYQTETTNIRNLNFNDFIDGVSVPLPPVAEQRRIVAQLETLLARVNATRERLARVPAILKRFRQSVLAAACSGALTEAWRDDMPIAAPDEPSEGLLRDNLPDLPVPPSSWHVARVRDIADVIQYGTSSRADGDASGVPMLRMGNIQDGRIDLSDLKYIQSGTENLAPFLVQPGDVLFNRTNSPELVGKAAVWNATQPAVFASYLIRVRCKANAASDTYLCFWINSPWGREWAHVVRTDGVSQSNINGTKLAAMPVPLPPLNEQHEIVRRVEALFKLTDAIEQRVTAATARADKLTQAILAKAFRGELVPTEAELARQEGRDYEPASVLLERIRSERAIATSEGAAHHSPRMHRRLSARPNAKPSTVPLPI